MNILLLSTHLNVGGIASYVVSLAKALKKRGHKVLVSSSGGDMTKELAKEDIPHLTLNIRTKSELSPKLFLAIPRLLSLIRNEDIHIIHAHTRVTQVLAWVLSYLSDIPYVTTCHGFFKRHLGRRIFKCWGQKTIAISDAVKKHLRDDFSVPTSDIALIYNGIDVNRFKKEFSQDEKDSLRKELKLKEGMIIGAIGRLSPVKGYRYLIAAFKHLLNEYKDLQLLIVGDGPEKAKLKSISKRLKLEEDVRFVEPRLDTPRLLSIMDVFVSASVQEGLGLALAEALAAARPVVASDVGGVSSLVKDNQTGLLVKPKESLALAGAISVLLKDSHLRENLGLMGRQLVEKNFALDSMVDKIEKVYENSIEKRYSSLDRILIVNVNWLGDVLFSTPFIKAIRKRFPTSFIACLVVPRAKEILEGNPHLDEIIIYDEDGKHKNIVGKLRLINYLKKKRFKGAFILHRSFTRALMVYLSGISRRFGYRTKHRGLLLTRSVEEEALGIHKVEYFLNIAKVCKAPTDDKNYEFFVNDSERKRMDKYLESKGVSKNDLLVILNPGGNWPPKRWPKENFAELSDRLSNELDVKIVISGALKDSGLAGEIVNLSKTKPINACGDTSIRTLGALMERAHLVISSDSGPMHLAVGVRSKVIALFGPTSDLITGPYGTGDYLVIKKDIGCQVPCYDFSCKDYRCMKAITVNEVFEKAKEILTARLSAQQ